MYAITDDGTVYYFGKGKPLRDIPKNWIKQKVILFERLRNLYNSGLVTIYEVHVNNNITLRYSMYRDGCFYEICGKCSIVKSMPNDTYIPTKVRDNIWVLNDVKRY